MIQIDYEVGKVQQQLGEYKKHAPKVISRAMNRAIQSASTYANKEVRQDYTLKAKTIRQTMTIERASKSKLLARFISEGRKLGIEHFKISPSKPRPNNPPKLKVEVERGKKIEYNGAFATDINGLKVFKRKGRSRLPIKRIVGPAVPQLLKNEELHDKVQHEAAEVYRKRLKHEINRVLESGRK